MKPTHLFLHVLCGPALYVLDEVVVKVCGEGRRERAGGPSCRGVGEGAGRVGCVAAAVAAAVIVAAAAAGGHVVRTGGGAPLAAARSTGTKRKDVRV